MPSLMHATIDLDRQFREIERLPSTQVINALNATCTKLFAQVGIGEVAALIDEAALRLHPRHAGSLSALRHRFEPNHAGTTRDGKWHIYFHTMASESEGYGRVRYSYLSTTPMPEEEEQPWQDSIYEREIYDILFEKIVPQLHDQKIETVGSEFGIRVDGRRFGVLHLRFKA